MLSHYGSGGDSFRAMTAPRPTPQPLLLYDGDCGFCGWTVRFVLRHDRSGVFHFAALASEAGQAQRTMYAVDPAIDSIVVLDEGRALVRSDAILAVLRRLGGAWHLLRIGGLLPRRVRDALYDAIARRRSRISRRFGLACVVPTAAERTRFLS